MPNDSARPLLNPVLRFTKDPSPQRVTGGGKTAKAIQSFRLGAQRSRLSREFRTLRESLAASKLGHLVLLTTQKGQPYSEKGFGNWIKKAAVRAGLPHCSAHGLRKGASRRLAEAGCSGHEIMSITGHQSLKEVERYTRAANRRGLADGAMKRVG